ncbi:MAG: DoxX family protein [Simkania sp.]|nr:DoxX family protein [Simkania sp.]
MKAIQMVLACVGRICMSVLFILAGLNHLLNWNESVQMLQNGLCVLLDRNSSSPLARALTETILPWSSSLAIVGIVLLILGGLLVFFGVKTRLGAFLLILFIVPTTLIFHAFWMMSPEESAAQMPHFMKNLSVFGGLLILLAFGNGSCARKASPKVAQEH